MSLLFVQSGMGWQDGMPTWYKDWDRGTESLPSPGTFGTNAPLSKTNGRITPTVVCLHESDERLRNTHAEHFERFLFRVMDKSDAFRAELDQYNTYLQQYPQLNLKSNKTAPTTTLTSGKRKNVYKGSMPANRELRARPACHMFNYQQLNFVLARASLEDGMLITPSMLEKIVRPLGISVTPKNTAELTQHVHGENRVLVTAGPQEMANEFGSNLEEGDTIFALFTPISSRGVGTISFRLRETANDIVTVRPTASAKPYYWRVNMVHGDCAPDAPVLVLDTGIEVRGFSYRLGRVQHIFAENHNVPTAYFGQRKSLLGPHNVLKEHDSFGATFYPTIRVMVDVYDSVAQC